MRRNNYENTMLPGEKWLSRGHRLLCGLIPSLEMYNSAELALEFLCVIGEVVIMGRTQLEKLFRERERILLVVIYGDRGSRAPRTPGTCSLHNDQIKTCKYE